MKTKANKGNKGRQRKLKENEGRTKAKQRNAKRNKGKQGEQMSRARKSFI